MGLAPRDRLGELAEILRKGGSFTNEEKVKIQDFAALYGIGS